MGIRDRSGRIHQGTGTEQDGHLSPETRLPDPDAARPGQFSRDQFLMMAYTAKSDALVAAAAQQGVRIDPAALMRTLIDSDRRGENPLQLAARLRRETGVSRRVLDSLAPLHGQTLSPTEQFILRTQEAAKKTQEERETLRGRVTGIFRGAFEGFMKALRSAFRVTIPGFTRGASSIAAAAPVFAAAAGEISPGRTLLSAAAAIPGLGEAFRGNSPPPPVAEPLDGLRRIFHLAGLTQPEPSAQRPLLLQSAPQFAPGT